MLNWNSLIERLKKINFANLSCTLYHTCSLKSLEFNLENNKIVGSNDISNGHGDGRKYTDIINKRTNEYFGKKIVSLTRNPLYAIAKAYNGSFCRIDLDGKELSYNYKIKPVNFLQSMMKTILEY